MFSEFRNAFSKSSNAHVQLILVNVAVYLMMAILMVTATVGGFLEIFKLVFRQLAWSPVAAEAFSHPWTIITYAFVHSLSDIWHIVFNMLTLYWFGRLFVEYLGSDKLIALYVLGAVAGALLYLGLSNYVPFFSERAGSSLVGASGSIYAIIIACATLIPDYTFYLLFIGPVRIKYIAMFFIVVSFLGTVSTNAGGNLAHLGGAAVGFVYIRQLQRGLDLGKWIIWTFDRIRNVFKPRIRITHRRTAAARQPGKEEVTQAEIDAILDKISAGGYESLSRAEKEKLFQAGKGGR